MHQAAPRDWLEVASPEPTPEPVIDPQLRLRVVTWLFGIGALAVLARAVHLEWTQGDAFRQAAAHPILHRQSLPGTRGRILARDATVLAVDQDRPALALRYRQLQEPPDPRWLRRQARGSLSSADRKIASRVAAEEARLLEQRRAMHRRLAALCGLSEDQWRARAGAIQQRVSRVSRHVNQRTEPSGQSAAKGLTFWQRVKQNLEDLLHTPELPEPIVVAEELQYHVVAEDVSLEAVAEVEAHPERYPGVRIEPRRRRQYPHGELAAHLIGHLGAVDTGTASERHPEDRAGRLGLELAYDSVLYGRRGSLVEQWRRSGDVVAQKREREPETGRDVTLTLDLAVQRAAETLLDRACRRRDALAPTPVAAGGAVIVMDVQSGALLAAASAPRFDPNLFAAPGQAQGEQRIAWLLTDPAHRLFDRTCRMALAPGSAFKPITAAALLEAARIDPAEAIQCRGYLQRTDAQRCAIYTRRGIGHGDVTLLDAMTTSCNVYFFRAAGAMGPRPLTEWATHFGLGRPTGMDLSGEAAGHVPDPLAESWGLADTQALAIGQSRLTVTPLQMARVMAALANGGLLVQPHVVNSIANAHEQDSEADADLTTTSPKPIEGLSRKTLAILREGLERVVADPAGTAHESVFLETVAIAGKTGTAETGGGLSPHAWFAGYCPAEEPRVAIVVVLEHAGDGGSAAGPVVRHLVEKMHEIGYFRRVGPKA